MGNTASSVSINKLSPHTGAEVRNADLTQPLHSSLRERLSRAFTTHSVLVFREQKLHAPQFLAAMQNFGEIFPQHNPRFAVRECPLVHYISNQDKLEDGTVYIPGEGYHTDHSNDPAPPKATALHAVKLPRRGGDTQFVNMSEAYAALPQETKRRISGLKARHVFQSRHSARKLMSLPEEKRKSLAGSVVHPLVRTHPETGRRSLYINPVRIEEIIGMEEPQALRLLDELLTHAIQLRFEYRHQWKQGDLVIWDNRCLLHKANGDYPVEEVRYLYRIMLRGETPV